MIAILLVLALVGAGVTAASAGLVDPTYAVNSTTDGADANPGDLSCETGVGNGVCTLRAAIQESNANGSGEIILPAGEFVLTLAGRQENGSATGDLDITGGAIAIVGAGTALSVIDADGIDRVIHVLPGANADLRNLTIRGGLVTDPCNIACRGGGILIDSGSSAYMQDVLIADSQASFGGGIDNSAIATLVSSTVRLNFAETEAGGIENITDDADFTIIDSTIADNIAGGGGGGGLENLSGTMRISGSTIHGNEAGGRGGGIVSLFSLSTLFVENSTVSGNTSGTTGGGIYVSNGLVRLRNVTLTNNVAPSGGGLFVATLGTLDSANSLIAKNLDDLQSPQDCVGTLASSGYNLIETISGCTITGDTTGNLSAQDPLLAMLADAGGPTLTHLPMAGSPTIDAGDPTGCKNVDDVTLVVDQRGSPRPVDGDGTGGPRCDIGAVEVVPEPSRWLLLVSGGSALAGLGAMRRRVGRRAGRPFDS